MRLVCAAAIVLVATAAAASPTIPLDDPVYERLAILRALGRLPLYLGGIRPLTEDDAQRLLVQAGDAPEATLPPPTLRRFWLDPAHRVNARLGLFSDEQRPYPGPNADGAWQIGVGGVAASCEHQEGRPCGQGGGGMLELDSAAGYGPWVSAFTRLQFMAGSNQWDIRGALDRAYINGQYGPVAIVIGRDVLVLGPGAHTQMLWGDHPAPYDHIRLQTAHPLKIPRIPVTVSALYAVGRMRDPQTFHNTVATVARLELAIADQLELGAQQWLELNGDGNPVQFTFWEFIGEHFYRLKEDFRGAEDGSHRRASIDATYTNKWARGLRLYYEIGFDDFRKNIGDMVLYDWDHLLGAEMPTLTKRGRHGLVVELQHNGPYMGGHTYFTVGETNAGRLIGSPLGPQSWSLYASARLDFARITVYPWLEWAQFSNDLYQAIQFGPILLTQRGTDETRVRLGARVRVALRPGLRVEASALYEHVATYGFVAGATRDHGGVQAMLAWTPLYRRYAGLE